MSLLTLSSTSAYARTSESQANIGTATTLGRRTRVDGALLLAIATTGSQFLVIGAASAGARLLVSGQRAAGNVVLALSGPASANPAPVTIAVPATSITSGELYTLRTWAGPGGCGISLRDGDGDLLASNTAGGATVANNDAASGRVHWGAFGGSFPSVSGGAFDGDAIYNTVPPDVITAPHPGESGILWCVVDQYGQLVPGATALDELSGASWGAGGGWDAPAPTVTSIAPDEGSESGGTAVTITGTGFRANATVTIGGTSATGVTVVDSTEITCTTPAGSVGDADVVVTNEDSQAGTLTDGFAFTSDSSPLAAGTATLGTVNPYLVKASATAATGGEGTVTQQWQRSPRGAGTWTDLTGQTALALTDRTVTAGTNYDYRLAYSDDNGTEYSNTLQPNVPAAFVSWGVLGDSQTDEYGANDSPFRGGGSAWEAYILNWLELLAQPNGNPRVPTHHRGFDFGAWGTRPEPRRTGHEYMWARSSSVMDRAISGNPEVVPDQLPGLAAQVAAGTVTHAILFATGNEWMNYEPFYAIDIYNSPDGGVTSEDGRDIETEMELVAASFITCIDELVNAGVAGMAVMTPYDYGATPLVAAQMPNATRRGYVSAAVAYCRSLIDAHVQAVNAAADHTVVASLPVDEALLPYYATADGQYMTIAGVEIDYVNDSPNTLHFVCNAHANTMASGLFANSVIAALNELPGISVAPFSDSEMLENAGIEVEQEETGTVTISGAGAISLSASTQRSTSVTVSDTGTIATTGSTQRSASVTISDSGTVSTSGSTQRGASVAISESGNVSATAATQRAASVTISGAGDISATGSTVRNGSVAVSGNGSITLAASTQRSGTVTVSGSGSISLTGQAATEGATTVRISGAGAISLSASTQRSGTAAASTNGQVTLTVHPLKQAAISISGNGAVSTTGTAASEGGGVVRISGSGSLTLQATTARTGSLVLAGDGTIVVQAATTRSGSLSISGGGVLVVSGRQVGPFNVHPKNIMSGNGPGYTVAGTGPGWRL